MTKVLLTQRHAWPSATDETGGWWTQRLIKSSVDFTASGQHRPAARRVILSNRGRLCREVGCEITTTLVESCWCLSAVTSADVTSALCILQDVFQNNGKRVFLSHASQGRSKKLSAFVASKTDLGQHQCRVFSFSVPLPVRRLTVNLSSRKIPGLNVYAQMQNEKEQEMKSPANPTEASAGSQRDLVHSLEILDTEFNSRPIGEYAPSSPESRCAARLVIICCHAIACLIATHPVPFFFVPQKWKGRGRGGTNES